MGNPDIQANIIEIGEGVTFGKHVQIGAIGNPARRVHIGDHTYIGDDVRVLAPEFSVGDYSKLHRHSLFFGYGAMRLGHNAWVGQGCTFDSTGGLTIGDNCCVGTHSSLWSHMRYGDTLIGCRFDHRRPLIIGKDVWIGDSVVVTPVTIADKALVLANSVVTHNCVANRIYANSPATDVTEKLGGPPFREVPPDERLLRLHTLYGAFAQEHPEMRKSVTLVLAASDFNWSHPASAFEVTTRTYVKRGTPVEVEWMQWLLPEKAKFTPAEAPR